MEVSQYGVGLAFVLFVGAVISRHVMLKALANAEIADAKTLSPEKMAEKLKVKNVVAIVLNVQLITMPLIGYVIGHIYLTPR